MVKPPRVPFKDLLPLLLFAAYNSFFVVMSIAWQIIVVGPRRLFFQYQNRENRPEVLDDPRFGVHGFARLKRLKLHYVANGLESKPLVLMLHGFPEFWYSWRHQLVELGKNYRAVAVDMRGYGESDKPNGKINYCIENLIADIKELIPALGYQKCYLVAHDWGGLVAWAFAQAYPSYVDKLVICNSPHSQAFHKLLRTSNKQRKMSWYMGVFQMPFLPEIMLSMNDYKFLDQLFRGKKANIHVTDDDVEAFKYTFSQGGFTGPINYYRAAFQYKQTVQYPSKKIQVPTLVIWGKNDLALSSELAEMSAEYCESCEVKYIEGASHWVQQDEPALVNKYIQDFISS